LKVVYLDQNKWIDLSRAFHGKTNDSALLDALRYAQIESQKGRVFFPLSWVHYLETAKNTNHEQRKRLGTTMWEISGGRTMASSPQIVYYELEVALSQRYQHVVPRSLELISTGVAHAFNEQQAYGLPEAYRASLPAEDVDVLERELSHEMEKSVITGESPDGTRMNSPGTTMYNIQFRKHLETLNSRVTNLPPEKWEDALHAIVLSDIIKPVYKVLALHNLSWSEHLEPLGKEGLTDLIEELPSRRVELHMLRQILKNPQLKPRDNDLEDWSGLGPATAHCDFVVCERHFSDLLHRDGYNPEAQVVTDVRKLPEILKDH
jgi:hypothetical protein